MRAYSRLRQSLASSIILVTFSAISVILLAFAPAAYEFNALSEPGQLEAYPVLTASDSVRVLADSVHRTLMLEDRFPSANTCATCHPQHYEEWSVSAQDRKSVV